MTNKRMDDLFANLRPQKGGDKRPQERPQKRSSTSSIEEEIETFLQLTVDQWIDFEGMHTIELNSPRGKIYMTKSKKAYKRLMKAGEVAFSPLEVERFIELTHSNKETISDKLVDHIYDIKRLFGARLYDMKPWPAGLSEED